MREARPIIELFEEVWEVIAKVETPTITFRLAVHRAGNVGAQIITTRLKTSIMQIPVDQLPSVASFEKIFRKDRK